MLLPATARADQTSAVQAARSQSKVIDALVDNGGTMWVSVKPEKLAWDQFAGFLCSVVRPHRARIFVVRVVDVASVAFGKRPSEWRQLGNAHCDQVK
jgi:hypothetical protein